MAAATVPDAPPSRLVTDHSSCGMPRRGRILHVRGGEPPMNHRSGTMIEGVREQLAEGQEDSEEATDEDLWVAVPIVLQE